MKDFYEVLDVERTASDSEIKVAYRKQALLWHPDKHQGRDTLPEAEQRFKEVVNAWEVLSDKHERAWYDSHRDAILRSDSTHQAGSDGTGMERPANEVDPFAFFTPSCFSGYGDGPRGFYTVYRGVFDRLAAEEMAAWEAADNGRACEALPTFGTSATAGSEVSRFYSWWGGFASSKTFSFADKWNPGSAPNRKDKPGEQPRRPLTPMTVRRLMEQENQKARRAARRVYNDAVRELATFAKRRDKRVAAWQAEQAAKRAEQEAAEQQRREAARQERQARAEALRQAEAEAAALALSDAEATSSSDEEQPQEPALVDAFYCVICDKQFKTAGALGTHERSRKHAQAFVALRKQLEAEEGVAADGIEVAAETEDEAGSSDSAAGSTERQAAELLTSASEAGEGHGEEAAATVSLPAAEHSSDEEAASLTEEAEQPLQTRHAEGADQPKAERQGASTAHADAAGQEQEAQPCGKRNKAKRRRQARKQQQQHPPIAEQPAAAVGRTTCAVCQQDFASRSKLFLHVREAGHAVLR